MLVNIDPSRDARNPDNWQYLGASKKDPQYDRFKWKGIGTVDGTNKHGTVDLYKGHVPWDHDIATGQLRPHCFVADAVYMNPSSVHLQSLREFRDMIEAYHLGRAFNHWYYSGNGQNLATLVYRFPVSRKIFRPLLTTISKGLEFLM